MGNTANPKTLADAKDTIQGLETKVADLGKQLSEAPKPEAVTGLQSDLDAKTTALNEANTKITSLETENADIKQQLSKANGDLTAVTAERDKLLAESKTVDRKAAEIAARNGLDEPVPVAAGTSEDDGGSGDDLAAQYAALKTPQERAAFRRKNMEALKSLAKKR